MNRLHLVKLAGEAARVERLTAHLRINGKPFHSLQLELEAEKEKDPLRPLKLRQENDLVVPEYERY